MINLLYIGLGLFMLACLFFAKNYYNSNAPERRARREARELQKRNQHISDRYYSDKPYKIYK